MSSCNHRLCALGLCFPLVLACGGISDSESRGSPTSRAGGASVAGGETSDFGGGTDSIGSSAEGDHCKVEAIDSWGGAGGASDCSSLEFTASNCAILGRLNTDKGTGGGFNESWTLTEGTYLLAEVSVSEGDSLVGAQFEGALVVSKIGPTDFRVRSELKGPMGELLELSTWRFNDDKLTPTKHCGDPETFLGFPLRDKSVRIFGNGKVGFTFPLSDDQVFVDFNFMVPDVALGPWDED